MPLPREFALFLESLLKPKRTSFAKFRSLILRCISKQWHNAGHLRIVPLVKCSKTHFHIRISFLYPLPNKGCNRSTKLKLDIIIKKGKVGKMVHLTEALKGMWINERVALLKAKLNTFAFLDDNIEQHAENRLNILWEKRENSSVFE